MKSISGGAAGRCAGLAEGRWRWSGFGAAAVLAVAIVAALGVQQPAPAAAQGVGGCTAYDAGIHTFVVPAGVTQIEANVAGAQGGDVIGTSADLGDAGLGGGATGVLIPVTPGESLEVVVGGAGINSTGAQSPAPPGGSPGGGGGGAVGSAHTSATGGGASSIRRGAQTLIIVGGGGGGAHGGSGGHGGLTGTNGTKHAVSTAGSTPGLAGGNGGLGGDGGTDGPASHDGQDGSAGQGGTGGGGTPVPTDGGGGGGGGAVGGGGGGGGPGNGATGGGGGSSFDATGTGTATFKTGVQQGDGQVTLCVASTPRCTVQTFDSPGTHTFEIPAWVTEIEADAFGAQGGEVLPGTDPVAGDGGLGAGLLDLAIPVTPGESLEIVVGGAGGDASGGGQPVPPGGSPGGGGAGALGGAYTSASGGGASEIRRGAQPLVVAAGGGGGAYGGDGGQGGRIGTSGTRLGGSGGITGGLAGGLGGTGGTGGFPGTPNRGQDGSAGQGGAGGSNGGATTMAGGGGGGGVVGGGGGGGGVSAGTVPQGRGGGGGSSAHATGGPATYQTGVREGNGLVTVGFACAPVPPGDVSVDKRASDGRVVVGDTVTYRLVAKNNGAGPANAVVVEDRVPGKLDVRSASSTQGDCSVSGNQVSCTVGTLAPGAEATVTIRATATEAGQSTNTGVVIADRCPAEGCDTDPAPVKIVKPTLGLTKIADERQVRAGGIVTYTIRVTNPSKRAVRNVRTCDDLPAGLVPVSAKPKVKVSKGRYCWTAKRIGAGKSKRYELVARTLPGAEGRTVNRASTDSGGARRASRAVRAVRILPREAAGGGVTG